jgi:hypothetical protein
MLLQTTVSVLHPCQSDLMKQIMTQDARVAERASAEIQKMGIAGKKMSAADYRAARRAGTIGPSAVSSFHCATSSGRALTPNLPSPLQMQCC